MLYGTVFSNGPSRKGHSYDVGVGLKQCAECNAVYSSSDVHSCVYYLQRLMRTIVGDTAFVRA